MGLELDDQLWTVRRELGRTTWGGNRGRSQPGGEILLGVELERRGA